MRQVSFRVYEKAMQFWFNTVSSIDDSEAFEPHSCSVGVDELDDLTHCSCRALDVGPTLFERQTAVCSIVAVTETAKNAEAKGFNRNSCLSVFSNHHFWDLELFKFSPKNKTARVCSGES